MAIFRESSRTKRRKKRALRKARQGGSGRFQGGVVRSRSNMGRQRNKTSMIAKVMLATEFGKKQGGIQKIGAAIIEQKFSGQEDSARTWHNLLDPFGLKGYGPGAGAPRPPVKPLTLPAMRTAGTPRTAGMPRGTGFQGKGASAVRPKPATIPVAGASVVANFIRGGIGIASGLATAWWLTQAQKGGGDTSTQLMLNIMEEIQYAIYIDNRLISVVDADSFEQFMANMKRNLQLRTRGLRSD